MLEVGTKEENIIKNSFYFIEGEPEPNLHTSSGLRVGPKCPGSDRLRNTGGN